MKVYITKGIPGSGKTTWALQKQRQHTIGDIVRANRDDIRELLCGKEYHNGSPIGSIENMVTVIQQNIISTAIVNNKDVIIDDCNLNPKFLKILTDFITRQSSPQPRCRQFAFHRPSTRRTTPPFVHYRFPTSRSCSNGSTFFL